jgi:8-oxo-dGTP diphosphatase
MPNTAVEPVHVAVGVIADRERVFVTRRRLGTHQGGKWEFPGGKVHAGETVLAALQRELHEELGITVRAAEPLMQVRHDYADKSVLLDTWTIIRYDGVPEGREGQDVRWVAADELFAIDFPAADLPIQRSLWLPSVYAISACDVYGHDTFMPRLDEALRRGLKLLQWREPVLDADRYLVLARQAVARCHEHGAKVLLNADPSWAERCGADGVHLNSRRLMAASARPLGPEFFVAASCHNADELEQASRVGADLVVLGPVMATASHPGADTLGWQGFERLCRPGSPARYALGGMNLTDIGAAVRAGGRGVALIRGLWDSTERIAALADVARR